MHMKPQEEAVQPATGIQETVDRQFEAAVREALSEIPGNIIEIFKSRLKQLVGIRRGGNWPGELISHGEALAELGPERLLGPDARNRAFEGLNYQVDADTVPFLPANLVRKVRELSERVPGLNPRLFLDVPTGPGGLPVTAQRSHEWWKQCNSCEELFYSADDFDCWYKNEAAYKVTRTTNAPQWRLITELVPGSMGKNYMDESLFMDAFALEHLSDVLPDEVRRLLERDIASLKEGDDGKAIRALVESQKKGDAFTEDQRIAAMLLTRSCGNMLLRPTLASVIDTSFVARRNGQNFLRDTWTRTNERSEFYVLIAGDCDQNGADVFRCNSSYQCDHLGASLSVEVS